MQYQTCHRCTNTHSSIVVLNGSERVCPNCITHVARTSDVSQFVAIDLTPDIECGDLKSFVVSM